MRMPWASSFGSCLGVEAKAQSTTRVILANRGGRRSARPPAGALAHLLIRSRTSGHPDDRLEALLHVVVCRSPARSADPHRGLSLPHRPAAPAGSILLDAPNHFPRSLGRPEGDQHLIDHHFVEHLISGLNEPFSEPPRVRAGSLNERG